MSLRENPTTLLRDSRMESAGFLNEIKNILTTKTRHYNPAKTIGVLFIRTDRSECHPWASVVTGPVMPVQIVCGLRYDALLTIRDDTS